MALPATAPSQRDREARPPDHRARQPVNRDESAEAARPTSAKKRLDPALCEHAADRMPDGGKRHVRELVDKEQSELVGVLLRDDHGFVLRHLQSVVEDLEQQLQDLVHLWG